MSFSVEEEEKYLERTGEVCAKAVVLATDLALIPFDEQITHMLCRSEII